jgi:glycosyltransferase involved in cell wall biosynthesis
MRILMPVLWFNEPGDGWTYFKEEAMRLARRGHSVVVLCPHKGLQFSGPEDVTVYRCSSRFVVARAFIINPFSFVRMMNKVLREVGHIDVVYDETSGLYPMSVALRLWFRFRKQKVPIIVGVHGQMRDLENRGLLTLLFESYLNVINRLAYMVADRVLISGENCRKRVESLGASRAKTQVMPFGLKNQGVRASERSVAGDSFVVGTVGRPTRAKGVDSLIRAFAAAKIPNSKLIVIGQDGEVSQMKKVAADVGGDVVFMGYRKDVPELLGSIDVFGNLSLSEGGVSGAQMEAMSAGLPSVVTPFADEIEHGKEALVVDFHDIDGAAKALRLLHSDKELRERLGRNAKLKAAELSAIYTWEVYLDRMEALFRELTA